MVMRGLLSSRTVRNQMKQPPANVPQPVKQWIPPAAEPDSHANMRADEPPAPRAADPPPTAPASLKKQGSSLNPQKRAPERAADSAQANGDASPRESESELHKGTPVRRSDPFWKGEEARDSKRASRAAQNPRSRASQGGVRRVNVDDDEDEDEAPAREHRVGADPFAPAHALERSERHEEEAAAADEPSAWTKCVAAPVERLKASAQQCLASAQAQQKAAAAALEAQAKALTIVAWHSIATHKAKALTIVAWHSVA
jgi:hypothetical protein